LESRLHLYSREAVMFHKSIVDKVQNKMCKLKLRTTEKKCQNVFSFSGGYLNTASKYHFQVPITQGPTPRLRK
jgi:hypothetical protein